VRPWLPASTALELIGALFLNDLRGDGTLPAAVNFRWQACGMGKPAAC